MCCGVGQTSPVNPLKHFNTRSMYWKDISWCLAPLEFAFGIWFGGRRDLGLKYLKETLFLWILVKFPYYMEPTWFHIMTFGHPWSQFQSLDYSKGRIRTRSLCLIFLHILTFEILKIQCEQSPEKVYTCSRCSRIFTSKRAKKNHVLKKVRNLFRLTLPLQFLSLKRTEALNTTCWVKTK